MKKIMLIILLASLSSCTHTKLLMYDNGTNYKPTTHIDVYNVKKPTGTYIEIGEVSTRTKGDYISRIKDEAKEAGADGVIILNEQEEGKVYVYDTAISVHSIKAVLIKYKRKKIQE